MVVESLSAVDDRLRRAQSQFEAVKKALRRYYASNAHRIRGKMDLTTGSVEFNPLYVAKPSERFHTILGEFLHDLRSSLDHLAWVLIDGTGGTTGERTYFPVREGRPVEGGWKHPDPRDVEGCKDKAVLAFFDAHQPHHLGADYFQHGLWVLERLAIIDRHRHVVTRGAGVFPIKVTTTGIPREWEYEFTAKRIGVPDEHGAILDLGPDTPDPNVKAQGTLHIAVQEGGPNGLGPHAVPLIKLLYDAYDETFAAIQDARARFF